LRSLVVRPSAFCSLPSVAVVGKARPGTLQQRAQRANHSEHSERTTASIASVPKRSEPMKPPVGEAAGKKGQVEAMFDDIAPKYDLLNRVLSAGVDTWWRRRAVAWLRADRPKRILDVATGTADLAVA